MHQKSSINWSFIVIFLLCALGGIYTFSEKVLATARVLGENIELPTKIPVMKVINEAGAPIILPRTSVVSDGQEAFVFTVENYQVTKTPVEATVWREDFAKVTAGLSDHDLVILDNHLPLGQEINYQIINPEAGKSGLIN